MTIHELRILPPLAVARRLRYLPILTPPYHRIASHHITICTVLYVTLPTYLPTSIHPSIHSTHHTVSPHPSLSFSILSTTYASWYFAICARIHSHHNHSIRLGRSRVGYYTIPVDDEVIVKPSPKSGIRYIYIYIYTVRT